MVYQLDGVLIERLGPVLNELAYWVWTLEDMEGNGNDMGMGTGRGRG